MVGASTTWNILIAAIAAIAAAGGPAYQFRSINPVVDQASDHEPQVARIDLRGRPKP